MAGAGATTDPGLGASGGYGGSRGNISTIDKSKPILEKTKSVGYNITTSEQIFAISTDLSASPAAA